MSELILCLNLDSLSHNYVVLIILTFNFIYDLVTHNADFFIIIVFFIFFLCHLFNFLPYNYDTMIISGTNHVI